jgi:alpha-mannosidase
MTEYTDGQIEDMRAQLAKTWRQSKSQVTDWEARFYLDLERELLTSLTNTEVHPR